MKMLALRAHEKGLELLCDIKPGVPEYVVGDSARIRQIVVNLVGNAIKFTEHGQVEMEIAIEDLKGDEAQLHFIVRDTGIGIALDKQKLIFEPFSQADSSTTRRFGGTGLGLTICARLVQAMSGLIWVESELGKGSNFHFTLWLGIAGGTSESPVEEMPLAGLNVLIVDDNATNRRILTEILRRWQLRPTAVADAQEALSQLRRAARRGQPFVLMVTDVHMPELDGFDLVALINDTPAVADVAIIMLTSGETRGDIKRCREMGVAAYLMKPVRRAELHAAIVQALNGRAAGENEEEALLAVPASSTAVVPVMHRARILLAEDNLVNQRLALRILEKGGYEVVIVNNGIEALAAVQRETFDLILMDVQMPEMDGLEAARAIRKREDGMHGHIPIIAMTAHAMASDRERCLAAGMDSYITKPIRASDLLVLIDRTTAAADFESGKAISEKLLPFTVFEEIRGTK